MNPFEVYNRSKSNEFLFFMVICNATLLQELNGWFHERVSVCVYVTEVKRRLHADGEVA